MTEKKYELNANEWRGTLTLNISAGTGTMSYYSDPQGQKVEYPPEKLTDVKMTAVGGGHKISFDRNEKNQTYTGWTSSNEKIIAGNFTYDDSPYAWYAVPSDS